MTKLLITKNTEAKTIATIYCMGIESLNPDDFSDLERIINNMHKTRTINREVIADELAMLSGKKIHTSDCGTSNSPAILPTPCNCSYK